MTRCYNQPLNQWVVFSLMCITYIPHRTRGVGNSSSEASWKRGCSLFVFRVVNHQHSSRLRHFFTVQIPGSPRTFLSWQITWKKWEGPALFGILLGCKKIQKPSDPMDRSLVWDPSHWRIRNPRGPVYNHHSGQFIIFHQPRNSLK